MYRPVLYCIVQYLYWHVQSILTSCNLFNPSGKWVSFYPYCNWDPTLREWPCKILAEMRFEVSYGPQLSLIHAAISLHIAKLSFCNSKQQGISHLIWWMPRTSNLQIKHSFKSPFQDCIIATRNWTVGLWSVLLQPSPQPTMLFPLYVHSGGTTLPQKHWVCFSIQRTGVTDPVINSLSLAQWLTLLPIDEDSMQTPFVD